MLSSNEKRFKIITKAGVVSADLHGSQNAKSMISCINHLKEKKQFQQMSGGVFNLCDADLHESFGDLLDMIDYTKTVGNDTGPLHWAFVSNKTTRPDFIDRYITLTHGGDVKIKRFQAEPEAREWLNTLANENKSKSGKILIT